MNFIYLFTHIFLSFGLICNSATLVRRSFHQGSTPTGSEAVEFIPDHDYDTKNIVLNLRFDWKQEQAQGTENFTFSSLVSGLNSLTLDAANMTITSVSTSGGKSLNFNMDPRAQRLIISLDHTYQRDESQTLVISYHTNGTAETKSINGGGGLTFIKPTRKDPRRPRQIWSQGETIYSHYWFPCFDHPNDFFTSEVIATVESPLKVISNGKLLNVETNRDGTLTYDWKIDQPHASYLTSIVVGEYTAIRGEYAGIPVDSYVYTNEVAEGRTTTSRLPAMVKFFSEKTGVKYPYAKYAQTMTRDFNGGMENISATTQSDAMLHDWRFELDESSDSLQSHELAHQWFGDLLTSRSWADIWLNESFATYFQALWDEHNLGEDDFLYRDILGNQSEYLEAWDRGIRRPIVTKNYSHPDAMFDVYAYARGAAVLHMLRKQLGDENWWRAINHYLTKYQHQPVETEEFRIAIEETTGQSFDRFFDQWLYRAGHPVFAIEKAYDSSRKTLSITVHQEQSPGIVPGYPTAGYFETPVEIEIGTDAGVTVERRNIEAVRIQTFEFPVTSEPVLVNFDYGSTIIKELRFPKPVGELAHQATSDPDVTGRIWATMQLHEAFTANKTVDNSISNAVNELAAFIEKEKFWGSRVQIIEAIAGRPEPSVRAALLKAAKDPDSKVRAAATEALSISKEKSLAGLYTSMLKDPSYAVVRAAANALAQTKAPKAFRDLTALASEPSWRGNITVSVLGSLVDLGDSRAVGVAERYLTNPEREVRAAAFTLLGVLGKGNRKDNQRVFTKLVTGLNRSVRDGDETVALAAAGALAEFGDRRGVPYLARAAKEVNDPDNRRALLNLKEALVERGTVISN